MVSGYASLDGEARLIEKPPSHASYTCKVLAPLVAGAIAVLLLLAFAAAAATCGRMPLPGWATAACSQLPLPEWFYKLENETLATAENFTEQSLPWPPQNQTPMPGLNFMAPSLPWPPQNQTFIPALNFTAPSLPWPPQNQTLMPTLNFTAPSLPWPPQNLTRMPTLNFTAPSLPWPPFQQQPTPQQHSAPRPAGARARATNPAGGKAAGGGAACAAFGCTNGCGKCFNPGSRAGKMCNGTAGRTGYRCPWDAGAGTDFAFACMDWTFGSTAMLSAEASFAQRSGEDVYFGVGTWGSAGDLGACYRLTVDGVHKDIIGQSLDMRPNVAGNQFELQVGAGGLGDFDTCTGGPGSMYSGNAGPWGCQYGGIDSREACANLPEFPQDDRMMKTAHDSLIKLCEYSFDKKVRLSSAEHSGGKCEHNPTIIDAARVRCPEELVHLTQIQRADDPEGYKEPSAPGFPNRKYQCQVPIMGMGMSYCLSRMMNCRKPSGGFEAQVMPTLMVYGRKLVQPCTADGYTRINVACGCADCGC